MQVIFKNNWFGPDGATYTKWPEPQEVPDVLVDQLPSSAVVVGPEDMVEEWNALREGDDAEDEDEADLLDLSVKKIVDQLDDMSDEEVEELREREVAGKTRSSLLRAIDERLADEDE